MKVLFICAALLIIVSCKTVNVDAKLDNVKWVLEQLTEGNVTENGSEAFLQFDSAAKKISGKAVCNRYFGDYEQDNNKLTFSKTGVTKMACLNMSLEDLFFKALADTDNFVIKNGKLSLMKGENVLAVFKSVALETEGQH